MNDKLEKVLVEYLQTYEPVFLKEMQAKYDLELPKDISEMSTNEMKDEYTVRELKKICKSLGMKGYSKLKEDQLVEKIFNYYN